jgi:hypothetical protein
VFLAQRNAENKLPNVLALHLLVCRVSGLRPGDQG